MERINNNLGRARKPFKEIWAPNLLHNHAHPANAVQPHMGTATVGHKAAIRGLRRGQLSSSTSPATFEAGIYLF